MTSTDCGVNGQNLVVYLSIFAAVISSYSCLLFRISLYMFFTRRLYTLKRRVQVKIGQLATDTYGFKHLIRAMKYN